MSGRTRRLAYLGSVIINACASIVAQLTSLLLLDSHEYGVFALLYLVYALGASVILSSIAEAWSRTEIELGFRDTWDSYSSSLLAVVLAIALVGLIVGLSAGMSLAGALWGAIAVGAGAYRSGVRYYQLRTDRVLSSIVADGLIVASVMSVWILALIENVARTATTSMFAWGIGCIGAACLSRRPALPSREKVIGWIGRHRASIGVLQTESILMDVGAIVTPLLLLPVLSISQFGLYRGVTSLGAPVGLILNPLRPLLARTTRSPLRSIRGSLAVAGVGALLGVGASAMMLSLGRVRASLGTLSELVPFAVPIGLFVAGHFVGHSHYIIVRLFGGTSTLVKGRLLQTFLLGLFPLLGGMLESLNGAVWGLAIAVIINAVSWSVAAARQDR